MSSPYSCLSYLALLLKGPLVVMDFNSNLKKKKDGIIISGRSQSSRESKVN